MFAKQLSTLSFVIQLILIFCLLNFSLKGVECRPPGFSPFRAQNSLDSANSRHFK